MVENSRMEQVHTGSQWFFLHPIMALLKQQQQQQQRPEGEKHEIGLMRETQGRVSRKSERSEGHKRDK